MRSVRRERARARARARARGRRDETRRDESAEVLCRWIFLCVRHALSMACAACSIWMMVRPQLDDRQWAKLEPLLVSGARGGRPPNDNRNFIEAVLWWRRTGVPWRDLPETFGPWKTVFNRFDRWSKAGKWSRLFRALQTNRDDEWHSIDSTINRAHQHSAGGKGGLLSRASVVRVGDFRQRSI